MLTAPVAGTPVAESSALPTTMASVEPDRKMSLARDFLARIKGGFARADRSLVESGMVARDPVAGLAEGEELLFRIRLPDRIAIDVPLLGRVMNGKVLLSFRDFTAALEFPIPFDDKTGRADGWYIRETKLFSLDPATRSVKSDNGLFAFTDNVVVEDGDVLVPTEELAKWFSFTLTLDVSKLDLYLESPLKLPLQERLARQKRSLGGKGLGEPELPLLEETPKLIDVPVVDVMTNSRYRRPGNGADNSQTHAASVQTAGDFMGGTLYTQSQLDREDNLTSVRATYKKESLEPELLGPLAARRFELGDVNAVNMSLGSFNSLGTGARVTNVHPLRSTLRPDTQITGNAFPGWDAELYRDGSLVAFQTVGDDGIYRFDNVELFRSDNTFKVILYGPQGEQREEEVYIPVDGTRLSDMGTVYDVSVNRQNTFLYQKEEGDDEDRAAPNLTALVEKPISDTTAVSAGLETGSRGGDQIVVGHAGISTILSEALVNLNTAVENTGEMAGELVARRNFGDHEFRSETNLLTPGFATEEEDPVQDIFTQRLGLNGPLDFEIGDRKPRYNLSLNYGLDNDGNNSYASTAGVSGSWRRLSASQQLVYSGSDRSAEDNLNSVTQLNGTFAGNRIRLAADYNITPESQLDTVLANVRRFITPKLEADFTVQHDLDPKLTEARAQLNWWAGFANISPGISYNTDNDFTATLATRFGLAKDPLSGDIRAFDRTITSNGGISAFVFLDNNGDNVFGEGDEPLPEVVILAPQNSGREMTDEKGYAYFNRLGHMRVTDVFIDEKTLKDPFWIPGYKGSSVLPREGHITSLQFPVHLSGEIDGSVYARNIDGSTRSLRGIVISLYTQDGKKAMSTVSESDGFYLLSKIPPGNYFLNVDTLSGDSNFKRPGPQPITIGYDGTTLYGRNIYYEQGNADVPYSILSDAASIQAADPKKLEGRRYVLNLGAYSSRLMMGLAWYKMRSSFGSVLAGVDLLEKPSESYVDVASGKHVLRVLAPSDTMKEAERRCAYLTVREQTCVVEILPGGLPQQVQAAPAPVLPKG